MDLIRSRFVAGALVAHAAGLALVGAAGGPWPARLVRVAVLGALVAGAFAAGIGRSGRTPRRPALWVALVVLVATTTVAATMGVSHARVDGMSLRAVAALVALAAGVVVLTAVTVELMRRAHRWWRLLALPVAVALLAFVVEPVFVAVYATAQPRPRLGEATPADVGSEYEDVSFTTPDGVVLSGWYLPSRNGAAVALLHGASSTRSGVLAHAVVLHRAGYGVLLFDARGHGRSDGEAMDLGWYGDLDVRGALDQLAATDGVDADRLAVVGMSMGGEEAIGAAAADDRVRAVVAEGAENRTSEDRDAWLPGGIGGWVQRRIDQLAFGLTDLLTPASPPTELRDAAATSGVPMLLLAGDGESRAARSIRAGSPDVIEIWETGVGHTRGLAELPEEWEARVIGFLDEHLG